MREVIEVFRWGYEGDYEQAFFVVEEGMTTKKLLKNIVKEMDELSKLEDFRYRVDLAAVFPELQVRIAFSNYTYIQHIRERYIVEGNSKGHYIERWK